MSVTIAPIRFVLFLSTFFMTWFFSYCFTINFTIKDQPGPIRAFLFRFLRVLARLTLAFMGFQYVEVIGKRVTTEEAPILVYAPHSSFMDGVVFFLSSPIPSPVSRLENYHMPFLHTLLKVVQPIFVSREDPDSRQATIKEVQLRTSNAHAQIGIFPEGTCTNRSALITFKCGAFIPGVPIQPVCVEYFPAFDCVSWVEDGPGGLELLWLGLCQINIKTRVNYLPIYTPSKQEKEDPRLFADNVREVMATAMKIPVVDFSFEDGKLMRIAKKYNLPQFLGLISFRNFNHRFGLTMDHAVSMMTDYSKKLYKSGRYQMNINEFADCQQIALSSSLRETFDICNTDGSGTIIFREYVMIYMLISLPGMDDETLKTVFKCFNTDNSGNAVMKDFYEMLDSSLTGYLNLDKLHHKLSASLPGSALTYDNFHKFSVQNPQLINLLRWCSAFSEAFPSYTDVNGNEKTAVHSTESTDSLKHRNVPNDILITN